MVEPSFQLADLDEETLHFWIEKPENDLIDSVTTKVMMEELTEM